VVSLLAQLGGEEFAGRYERNMHQRLKSAGSELSTGDLQVLLIARAMLRSPPLLLLDSVDTHLAPATVAKLTQMLRDYSGIVIMTASRPELIAEATQQWRIEAGQVTASKQPRSAATPLTLVPALPIKSSTP
jgi:putative ABC transport system ATP-binding protein